MASFSAEGLLEHLQQSNYSYRMSYTKRVHEANESVQNLRGNLEDFRKSVRDLKKYTSGVTSTERMEKQITGFIKSYNKISSNAGKITDKELKKQLNELDELIGSNEKQLEKIGITKNKKGKLEFDTEEFEEAETKYLDELFSGRNSFISKAGKILRGVDKNVDEAEYTTVERNISFNKKYDKNAIDFVKKLTIVQSCTADLSDIAKEAEANGEDSKSVMEKYKNKIIGVGGYFDELFRRLDSHAFQNNYETDGLDNVKAFLENEEILGKLEKIGITPQTDSEGNFGYFLMDFDYFEKCFEKPELFDKFYEAFQSLFGEGNIFANAIIDGCKKAFDDIINPEYLGVEIIDQYV